MADALSRLPQYDADVKGLSVSAASKSKARSKGIVPPVLWPDSIGGEEKAAITHLGYLAGTVSKQRAVVDEVDSDSDEDGLPSLSPLTAHLAHLDSYYSSAHKNWETLEAQKQFEQGMTDLLTSAGFMNVPSSEIQNDSIGRNN